MRLLKRLCLLVVKRGVMTSGIRSYFALWGGVNVISPNLFSAVRVFYLMV